MNRIERAARRPDFLTFDETAQLLRTSNRRSENGFNEGSFPEKKSDENG